MNEQVPSMKIKSNAKKIALFLTITLVIFLIVTNMTIMSYANHTLDDTSKLPQEYACLVLGTSKKLTNGSPNLFYEYRMNAALAVYSSGKCKKIVVSGDNRHANYNEPKQMKKSLMEKGIPEAAIHCDYAGGRTLDSVIRFKKVFGQSTGIVISQKFHNERAIFIASHNNITLTGFNAKEVNLFNSFKTKGREVLSRGLAVLDVIFHSKPRHLGEKVLI
jgi:SanA protein